MCQNDVNCWFQTLFTFRPCLKLTIMFGKGWNHEPVEELDMYLHWWSNRCKKGAHLKIYGNPRGIVLAPEKYAAIHSYLVSAHQEKSTCRGPSGNSDPLMSCELFFSMT